MRDSIAGRIFLVVLAMMLAARPAVAQRPAFCRGSSATRRAACSPRHVTIATLADGGARTTDTAAAGTYQFTALPPGVYEVTYELSGFSPLKRADIRIQVAQVTRLDVDLKIGSLQETVVVTGVSPVVDVGSTTTQTNVSKEIFDTIPTGRNPWVMAGLVPGVITGRLDVGGTEGMQQYNIEAFGSADSQKSFSIDGLKTNWAAAPAARPCSTTLRDVQE